MNYIQDVVYYRSILQHYVKINKLHIPKTVMGTQ